MATGSIRLFVPEQKLNNALEVFLERKFHFQKNKTHNFHFEGMDVEEEFSSSSERSDSDEEPSKDDPCFSKYKFEFYSKQAGWKVPGGGRGPERSQDYTKTWCLVVKERKNVKKIFQNFANR